MSSDISVQNRLNVSGERESERERASVSLNRSLFCVFRDDKQNFSIILRFKRSDQFPRAKRTANFFAGEETDSIDSRVKVIER